LPESGRVVVVCLALARVWQRASIYNIAESALRDPRHTRTTMDEAKQGFSPTNVWPPPTNNITKNNNKHTTTNTQQQTTTTQQTQKK
jgi:hypothetical protein